MARSSILPEFHFHLTDLELVRYYLKRKVLGKSVQFDAISELNIYKYSPWDLLDISCLRSKDLEWYFFCPSPNEKKYGSGARTNRVAESGYWESTGKDKPVFYNEQIVGMVKTLVFHIGHVPKWERTDWVMHEYRLQDMELADVGVVQDAYVLCKVFQKSDPFSDEDGDDDAGISGQSLSSNNLPSPVLPHNENNSVGSSISTLGSMCSNGPLYELGPSNVLPSADEVPPPVPNYEDFISLLDLTDEDGSLLLDHTVDDEMVENFSDYNIEVLICLDGDEIHNSLFDPDNLADPSGGRFNFFGNQTTDYGVIPFLPDDDEGFLELNDLNYPLNFPTESTGSRDSLTDSLCELCYNNYREKDHFPVDSFADFQHVLAMNQLPLLLEETDEHDDNFLELQENDDGESSNMGSTVTCIEDSPSEQPEVGNSNSAVQDQKSHYLQ